MAEEEEGRQIMYCVTHITVGDLSPERPVISFSHLGVWFPRLDTSLITTINGSLRPLRFCALPGDYDPLSGMQLFPASSSRRAGGACDVEMVFRCLLEPVTYLSTAIRVSPHRTWKRQGLGAGNLDRYRGRRFVLFTGFEDDTGNIRKVVV